MLVDESKTFWQRREANCLHVISPWSCSSSRGGWRSHQHRRRLGPKHITTRVNWFRCWWFEGTWYLRLSCTRRENCINIVSQYAKLTLQHCKFQYLINVPFLWAFWGYGWAAFLLGRGGGRCSPVPLFCTLRKYFCAWLRICKITDKLTCLMQENPKFALYLIYKRDQRQKHVPLLLLIVQTVKSFQKNTLWRYQNER